MKWFKKKIKVDKSIKSDEMFEKLVKAEETKEEIVEKLKEKVMIDVCQVDDMEVDYYEIKGDEHIPLTKQEGRQINKYLANAYSKGYVPKIVKKLILMGKLKDYQ